MNFKGRLLVTLALVAAFSVVAEARIVSRPMRGGINRSAARRAKRDRPPQPLMLAAIPNRQSFTKTMGPGVLEVYYELSSPAAVYSKFSYAGCKAVLPKEYSQSIVAFIEAPTQSGPGELAPIIMQPLGTFLPKASPGVNLLEGKYFAGGGEINIRIRGPMGGSTSPIPANRVTIRRSSGDGTASVWCFVAGEQEQ